MISGFSQPDGEYFDYQKAIDGSRKEAPEFVLPCVAAQAGKGVIKAAS